MQKNALMEDEPGRFKQKDKNKSLASTQHPRTTCSFYLKKSQAFMATLRSPAKSWTFIGARMKNPTKFQGAVRE